MKPRDTALGRRIGDRDAALKRLRRTTVLAIAGTSALAAAFGGLAAKAFSGHSHKSTAVSAPVKVAARAHPRQVAASPPPLVPVPSAASGAPSAPSSPSPAAPAPSPPPAPPAVTQAPPVAVSGGS